MKNYIKNYKIEKQKITINLKIKGIPLTTDHFPGVTEKLQKHLPSVFKNKCFNEKNLSFYKESQKTELGHLFEHILLEYMCLTKIAYTNAASYSGRTYWRADKPDGNFRVEIKCGITDLPVFITALQKSVTLMDSILTTDNYSDWGQSALQTAPANLS